MKSHEIPAFPVVNPQHFQVKWSTFAATWPSWWPWNPTPGSPWRSWKGGFCSEQSGDFWCEKSVGGGEILRKIMSETSWFSKSFAGFSWGEVLKMLAVDWSTESVGWAHYEWKSDAIDGNTWEYTHQKNGDVRKQTWDAVVIMIMESPAGFKQFGWIMCFSGVIIRLEVYWDGKCYFQIAHNIELRVEL